MTQPIRYTILICIISLLARPSWAIGTYDDDTSLQFYWDAATGDVHHYVVRLYVNDAIHPEQWITPAAPTQQAPFTVPIEAEDGKTYQLEVQAENANSLAGPVSDKSDPVMCKLRSPGDIKSPTAGDTNGDLRVDSQDWKIISSVWKSNRGDKGYNYKADLNYDDSVNILDLVVVMANWGKLYDL